MKQTTSAIETLLEIMRRRRNIRAFKPDPVPDEYINLIMEAARYAASGANTQPWEFIVVRDPGLKEQIAEVYVDGQRKRLEIDPKFPARSDLFVRKKFADAPVLIAVCADPRLKEAYPGSCDRDSVLYMSVGAAMQHAHLAAAALGLAMCWGSADTFLEEPLGKLLGVPKPLKVKEVFSLGFPLAQPLPKPRRSLSAIVHLEKMDVGKIRTDDEIAQALATRRVPDVYPQSERRTDNPSKSTLPRKRSAPIEEDTIPNRKKSVFREG